MPVATQASLKGLTPKQLEETGCRLCLNNTYHLYAYLRFKYRTELPADADIAQGLEAWAEDTRCHRRSA